MVCLEDFWSKTFQPLRTSKQTILINIQLSPVDSALFWGLSTQNRGIPKGNPTHTYILGMGWVISGWVYQKNHNQLWVLGAFWYGIVKMGNIPTIQSALKKTKTVGMITNIYLDQ